MADKEIETTADEQEQAQMDAVLEPQGSAETASEQNESVSASEPVSEPAMFVGNYTAEQVLDLLGTLEKLKGFDPSGLEQRLSRSLAGHLGPIAQRLKAVETLRDVEIDPAFFAKVKELDFGMGELLEQNLPAALKGKRHDPQEFLKPLLDERLGALDSAINAKMHDYRQSILVDTLVPDWKELQDHPSAEAFVGKLQDSEIAALTSWYDDKNVGQKDGRTVAAIFTKLKTEIAAKEAEAEANAKALKAAARPQGRGTMAKSSADSRDEEQRAMDEVLNSR